MSTDCAGTLVTASTNNLNYAQEFVFKCVPSTTVVGDCLTTSGSSSATIYYCSYTMM